MTNWSEYNSTYKIEHALPRIDWRTPIDEFLNYLVVIGRTQPTIRTRYYQLARSSRQLDKPICDVKTNDVITMLANPQLGLSARKGIRSALKSFYEWYINICGINITNPVSAVPSIPDAPGGGKICPEDVIARAVTHSDIHVRVACMMAGWLGMRRIEISRTRLDDLIEQPRLILRVDGKGRKRRLLPVPTQLAVDIRKLATPEHEYLFPGKFTPSCSVDYIDNLIRTGTEGWAPHTLRRRFATVAYYNSHDILAVSRLLGHSDAKTTMRYIGILHDDLSNLVDTCTNPWQGNTRHVPQYSGWANEETVS